MKVDWKHLATTPGYRSLKQAVASCNGRSKKERYALFYKIISVAVSHAHHSGKPVEHFLNQWEENRSTWWFGYYVDSAEFMKKPTYQQPPYGRSLKSWRRHYQHWYRNDPARRKRLMCDIITRRDRKASKRQGDKARWSKRRKDAAAYWRKRNL